MYSLIVGLLLAQAPAAETSPSPEDLAFFETSVRPVLVEHCGKCHGATKQWASLRLDSREAFLKGGDSGPAIVPGKPDESLLIQAVRQTDAFCARLVELALLEPFEADVLPVGAGRKRVTGMWRVAEGKLRDLPGATLSQLMRTGYLSRIHAHLMSLDLFHRLLELDVARAT